MSWEFWSDFLNSKEDSYPISDISDKVQKDAENYKKNHKEMANLIEQIIDNPKFIEKINELNKEE